MKKLAKLVWAIAKDCCCGTPNLPLCCTCTFLVRTKKERQGSTKTKPEQDYGFRKSNVYGNLHKLKSFPISLICTATDACFWNINNQL